ncbi:MAG TPA: DinB family protein [Acidimicrobiia bacterium]|nr:DinB family protein [Acidimicrobiia bacterium]
MTHSEIARPDGYEPGVGALLAMMEDCRERTLRLVEGLDPARVDEPTPWHGNTAGSLLYHVAAIELDWLYSEVMSKDFPEEAWSWFPHDVREEDGRLTPVLGEALELHLDRLAWVRDRMREELRALTDADLQAVRKTDGDRTVTPEWVFHHLMQHEAEHRGQLGEIMASRGT